MTPTSTFVPSTSTHDFLILRYGPLLSLSQLAELLHRSADGLRLSLRGDGELARKFGPARKKIGRRVYFRTVVVAPLLDEA